MRKIETATCTIDLALHKPNYETEFAAFEPKEET